MEAEINAIIEKNLPAQVGEVLKKRLEQAEKDAAKVSQLEDQLRIRSEIVDKLESAIRDYEKFDQRNSALTARESAVSEAERNLKIATLEFQLEAEIEKTAFSKSVAMGLVRNTEYRKSVFDSENQLGYHDGNGNWVCPTPINKSLTENKSAD